MQLPLPLALGTAKPQEPHRKHVLTACRVCTCSKAECVCLEHCSHFDGSSVYVDFCSRSLLDCHALHLYSLPCYHNKGCRSAGWCRNSQTLG